MKPLIIKNKTFGEGTPKICIPITGRNEAEIMEAAGRILNLPHDMAEWRSDFFEQVTEPDKVCHILSELRRVLSDSLLLFTFRTHKEGGVRELSDEAYLEICRNVLESRLTDLLDLELFTGEEALLPLISLAHKNGISVILSNHDFHKTPPEEEICRRLAIMEKIGGDIAKIAVMPETKKDVLTLLSATLYASEHLNCPAITMSMGPLGVISRLCGEVFGSCLTFGTAGEASAPGQMDAANLEKFLEALHI